jgi:hypothetical protein
MDTKVMAAGAIGAGIGTAQTLLLREYVDRKRPLTNINSLKGFGTPSVLAGIGLGILGLGIGLYGSGKGKDGRPKIDDIYVEPAIDYGAAALIGGIISGIKPARTAEDCVAAGGFFYDDACHKTAQTGTVSMNIQPPEVQTSQYRPPLNPSWNVQEPAVDMNVLKQMSSEIQRLSSENAQLIQAQTMQPGLQPGTVSHKQQRYGFMDMGIAPGQPTDRAREYGFMEGMDGSRTPIAKVQQMKARYDFSG